ncbi:MAG: transporter substrate-binding domain-containing protein [Eubacteriales bacterium]|nr:transporter substrate-binding domain-containing protein [Eubacteriales bacterium]
MKKKAFAMILAAAMVCGMSVSAWAEDGRTLIVGFDAEYPPFGYMNEDGDYVGFDLDLAQLVCDSLGWTLEKKPINWDSKDMELNSGTIDCIWNGFTINGREDDYTWSEPYLNNEQVIVVAADAGIESLADLAGKDVLVQADSAALDALNNDDNKDLTASFHSLTEVPEYNTAFMRIDSGAAQAVAVDVGVANYQLSQREEGKYVILDEAIQSEQYGIGFKLGNEELKDQVWAEVLKLYEEGKVEELADTYGVDKAMICIEGEAAQEDADEAAEETDAAAEAEQEAEEAAEEASEEE